ncbi:hypothetical protein BHM03_00014607 [Ensete ventricosum]|nr:hypothetical protein BHM03_00014607 [Ensete ventricosum]
MILPPRSNSSRMVRDLSRGELRECRDQSGGRKEAAEIKLTWKEEEDGRTGSEERHGAGDETDSISLSVRGFPSTRRIVAERRQRAHRWDAPPASEGKRVGFGPRSEELYPFKRSS